MKKNITPYLFAGLHLAKIQSATCLQYIVQLGLAQLSSLQLSSLQLSSLQLSSLQLSPLQLSHVQLSRRISTLLMISLVGITAAGCAHKAPQAYEQTAHTQPLQNTLPSIKPRVVSLAPIDIQFARYWQRDRLRDHTKQELEELRQRYQTSLQKTLEKALIQHGWTISPDAPLVAALKIEKMHIAAPDFDGAMSRLYAPYEFGHANFSLTLAEGKKSFVVHDDYLAATGGVPHKLIQTNRLLNSRAFSRALSRFLKSAQKNVE